MAPPPPAVPSRLTIAAARKIGALRSTEILLVELEGHLLGVLDLKRIATERDAEPIADHMCSLARALSPTATAQRARDWLVARGLSAVPVVVGMFLVGAVSRAALERALAEIVGEPLARVAA
jgi:CBS domain-containing protein